MKTTSLFFLATSILAVSFGQTALANCANPQDCYDQAQQTLQDAEKQLEQPRKDIKALTQRVEALEADNALLSEALSKGVLAREVINCKTEIPARENQDPGPTLPITDLGLFKGCDAKPTHLGDAGWHYVPVFLGTDLCGGVTEYHWTMQPSGPEVTFNRMGPRPGCGVGTLLYTLIGFGPADGISSKPNTK